MNALLSSELLKLRTIRGPRWIAGVSVALAAAAGAVNAHVVADEGRVVTVAELARGPLQQAWFAVIVLAVLAAAGEFQHRTMGTTLLATPRRSRVLVAKAVSMAVAGMVVVTAAVAASVAGGLASVAASSADVALGDGRALALVPAGICLGALWAVAATGLGILTRSTALSLVVVLLWKFVLEGVVPVILRDPGAYAWTPSGAGDALVGLGGERLPAPGAALLLGVYVLVLCGAAAAAFVRRDPV